MDKQSLILVIDDEPDFCEIFSKKLQSEGFRVETASSGQEGIEKAKALKPDLILMDVKMPGMDGVETLMKMKEDPETKNLRVVFLSSIGSPGSETRNLNTNFSKDIGAIGYVQKTEDFNSIVPQIKTFIPPA